MFKSSIFGAAKSLAVALVAASFFGTSAVAGGILYDCTVKQTSGPRGWISPRVALVIDDKGAGQIIDTLTLRFETGPRPARLRRQGDTLRARWSFSGVTDRTSQIIPQFNFNATLNTKTGKFKMRGKPPRFPQSVSGNGTCVQRKDLSTKDLSRLLRG